MDQRCVCRCRRQDTDSRGCFHDRAMAMRICHGAGYRGFRALVVPDPRSAGAAVASPHFSPPFHYARRSARRKGAYSLQPARRSVSYAFAVFWSVPPSQRHPDALATNGGEKCGLAIQFPLPGRSAACASSPFGTVLARISHRPSATHADLLAVSGRTPCSRLDVVSATPSPSSGPCPPTQRHLDALATNGGERCGLGHVRGSGRITRHPPGSGVR